MTDKKKRKRVVVAVCWNCDGAGEIYGLGGCRTCGGCGELISVKEVKEDEDAAPKDPRSLQA